MEPGIELLLLSAFVDDELDVPRQRETQSRVARDARLRAQVEGLRQLTQAIRAHACRHAIPEALVSRVRASGERG